MNHSAMPTANAVTAILIRLAGMKRLSTGSNARRSRGDADGEGDLNYAISTAPWRYVLDATWYRAGGRVKYDATSGETTILMLQ